MGSFGGERYIEIITKITILDRYGCEVYSNFENYIVTWTRSGFFCSDLNCYKNTKNTGKYCDHIKYVRALIYRDVDESLRGKVIENIVVEYGDQSIVKPVVTRIQSEELITYNGELKRKIWI